MAALVEGKGRKGVIEAPVAPRFGRVKSNLKMGILGLPNVREKLSFFQLTHKVSRLGRVHFLIS
jgi:hypothetical protein